MIRRTLLALFLACSLSAVAQVVPAANYTDIWLKADEPGWGLSFTQHASGQAYAVWYTYDPRLPDPNGQFKPLWIVMSGGVWTNPTTITGPVYVLNGTPYAQPWDPARRKLTSVGTFTIAFTDFNHANFTYSVAAPAGLASSDPAFNLPTLTGTKPMVRTGF